MIPWGRLVIFENLIMMLEAVGLVFAFVNTGSGATASFFGATKGPLRAMFFAHALSYAIIPAEDFLRGALSTASAAAFVAILGVLQALDPIISQLPPILAAPFYIL